MYAKIIKDSQMGDDRLITFEVEFHRFILPELNTHRVFSRNYQSSRAVPIESLIKQVRDNPAMPVHWGANQRGMVAEEENSNFVNVMDFESVDMSIDGMYEEVMYKMTPEDAWIHSAKLAAEMAEEFSVAGYHKQIVNRILEPFMLTRGVITATEKGFESFFKLRCHPDAQPEIKALAEVMRETLDQSKPQALNLNEWHLPYVDSVIGTKENIMISTSCVAQVSYRQLDDSLEKAKRIYSMLNLPSNGKYPQDPPHFSPAEHCAVHATNLTRDHWISGNFHSFSISQYRKILECGNESRFIAD